MIRKILVKTLLAVSAAGLMISSMVVFADAAKDLENKLLAIQTLQSDFSQVVTNELGSIVDQSSGRFELERPMKFRWLVRDPYEQEIISDGVSLWQFDKDIEQINVSNLDDTMANSPAALLSQAQLDMARDYKVASLKGETEGHLLYHLSPVAEDALFEVMVMEFDGEQLAALQIKDNLGQTTLVEFANGQYNQKFSEDYFKFSVPAGIDLIDSRQPETAQFLPPNLLTDPESNESAE